MFSKASVSLVQEPFHGRGVCVCLALIPFWSGYVWFQVPSRRLGDPGTRFLLVSGHVQRVSHPDGHRTWDPRTPKTSGGHYTCAVNKRVVHILLECFLVVNVFVAFA